MFVYFRLIQSVILDLMESNREKSMQFVLMRGVMATLLSAMSRLTYESHLGKEEWREANSVK